MQLLTWWTRRARVMNSLDAILHAHNRQGMETHQMSLDLSRMREAQGRLTGAIENLVSVVSSQNRKIAELTAALAAASAPSTSPEDQASLDAAADNVEALADKARLSIPAPPPTTGL